MGETAWTKYAPSGSMADRINKMSANSNVNSKGKIHGGGSAKDTSMGKSLSRDATNSMGKISKTMENGPSATCMGEGKRKY